MRTIWKYHLHPEEIDGENSIVVNMPIGAFILDVQNQFDELMLWAQVDTALDMEPRRIWIFGSGHSIPNSVSLFNRYIGTVQFHGGALVLHIYGAKS